jgi:hypothetical protein
MANRAGSALPLLLPLLLGGCLEMQREVTLAADGSGTDRLVLALTDEVLSTARSFAGASQEDLRDRAPDDVFREESVARELRSAGLEPTGYRLRRERRARFVEIDATFASLAVLRQSPLAGPRAEWSFTAGPKAGQVRVRFWPQGREAHETAEQQAKEIERNGLDETRRIWFERQRARIAGLDLRFALVLPGDVIEHGGGWRQDGARTMRAAVTAEDVTSAAQLVRLLAPQWEVLFDGRACRLALDPEDPRPTRDG